MKFELFTPEVGTILNAIRAGQPVDEGCEMVQRVRRALRTYGELMTSTPHAYRPGPQSALFARLLSGRQPLRFPPPTSFSNPWYELVEEPGPHLLSSVNGVDLIPEECKSNAHERVCFEHIFLDQCLWGIVSANAAAEDLLEIDRCFSRRSTDAEPALAPYWDDIRAAYFSHPVLLVRYGQWPTFRMRVGRVKTTARRDHALKAIAAGGRIDSIYGPLDLSALDLNARIGEKVCHFDLPAHCEQKRRRPISPRQEGIADGIEVAVESAEDCNQQAIDEYLANPSTYDFVEFEVDAWVLEVSPDTAS